MFTGIITHRGTIKTIERNQDKDMRVVITPSPSFEPVIGASIACDGCCLTVVEKNSEHFTVDVSAQTLSCTTLDDWKEGYLINLEQALRVGDELGGHFVTGHVDGLTAVSEIESIESSHKVTLSAPSELMRYVADKGSITLAGVSLTVTSVTADTQSFSVNIIPHTWEHTGLGALKVGAKINMEIDVLARYVLK